MCLQAFLKFLRPSAFWNYSALRCQGHLQGQWTSNITKTMMCRVLLTRCHEFAFDCCWEQTSSVMMDANETNRKQPFSGHFASSLLAADGVVNTEKLKPLVTNWQSQHESHSPSIRLQPWIPYIEKYRYRYTFSLALILIHIN